MEKTLMASSRMSLWCIALSTTGLFAFLLKADDPYFVFGGLLAVTLSFGWWKRRGSLNTIDGWVLAVYVYEIVLLVNSFQPDLAQKALATSTIPLLYYFMLRCWMIDKQWQKRLLVVYSLLFGIVALLALASFYGFREAMYAVGFDCLYEFRHLYRPMGVPDNDWAGLQLLFLGLITLAVYQYRTVRSIQWGLMVLYAVVSYLLLVSFSRGVYVALLLWMLWLLACWWRIRRPRWLSALLALQLAVALATACQYGSEMAMVCRMNHTVSQQRSTQGRIQLWKQVVQAEPASVWTGTGPGTYVRQANVQALEDPTRSYTSYASNLFLQIWVEKGVIGLLLYAGLMIAVCVVGIQKGGWTSAISVGALGVFLWREQSFSIFFHSLQAQWLVYTYLALLAKDGQTGSNFLNRTGVGNLLLALLPILAWGMLEMFAWQRKRIECHQDAFAEACRLGDDAKAEEALRALPERTPFLMERALYHQSRYVETREDRYAAQAYAEWEKAYNQTPEDNMSQYGMACLLAEKGCTEQAWQKLDSLAKIHPRNSMYFWKMYELCCAKGDSIQASEWLSHCAAQEPVLLGTSWMSAYKQDSVAYTNLCRNLKERIGNAVNNDPLALARTGKILMELGEYEKAERCLSQAVRLLPNLSMAWYNWGRLKELTGQAGQAVLYKRRGVTLDAGFAVTDEAVKVFEAQRCSIVPSMLYGWEANRYLFLFEQWYTYNLIERK